MRESVDAAVYIWTPAILGTPHIDFIYAKE
jgi:hypothetical protein